MSLQEQLYTQPTVEAAIERYVKELSEQGDMESILHANKYKSYLNMMKDRQFIRDLRRFFNETYSLLEREHPELKFSIAGRRKSVVSTEKKILQYTELGQSLDFIRDFFAFRLILFGDNSVDLIKHCYSVLEDIIECAASKGFTPCERLPLLGVTDIKNHTNSYFSTFKYKHFVKDYICFPKENGYQSIHLVLVDTKGRYFEIQVRTLEMHVNIESGPANHEVYKREKFTVEFPFEREKISVHGYAYKNGKVFDYAGVEFPMPLFERLKTF